MLPAEVEDSSANFLTSSATTAKPLPDSPARAASIAAFSANRFVYSEIDVIIETISSILFDFSSLYKNYFA